MSLLGGNMYQGFREKGLEKGASVREIAKDMLCTMWCCSAARFLPSSDYPHLCHAGVLACSFFIYTPPPYLSAHFFIPYPCSPSVLCRFPTSTAADLAQKLYSTGQARGLLLVHDSSLGGMSLHEH